MKNKVLFLACILSLSLLASCGEKPEPEGEDVTITDTAGREVTINTAKVKRVICVGAGALRMYTYAGDLSLLVGAEDIDRGVESANPFKEAARPYYDANKEYFEKILKSVKK